MLSNKTTLGVLIGGFIALTCAVWATDNKPDETANAHPSVQPVKIMEISQPTEMASLAAEISASQRAQLGFRVGGALAEMNASMGHYVHTGDLLAKLDPTDFLLAQQAASAQYELASIRAQRDAKLHQRGLISDEQYDNTRTERVTAELALKQASEDLRDTEIRAPFDGYVSFTSARAAEYINANTAIITVENNQMVDLHINLPVVQAQHIASDLPITVRFGGNPTGYEGAKIKEFATSPDPDTNSYRITLSIPRPDDIFALTGMNAWVEVPVAANQITLPTEALFARQGQQASVWRIDSQKQIHQVTVTLDDQNQLISGLDLGDEIVAAGVHQLEAGQQIRRWTRERGI
ncbi:MAG: efflux RND transporter periplasmic adaptor subunit [Ferrimonas sp.]